MRTLWLTGFLAVLISVLVWGSALGQTSIHSDVNLVSMSFTVRDAQGGLVDNLTKDDFEVFEDGVPQKIAFFARSVDVPLTLGLIVDASGSQSRYSDRFRCR